MNRSSVAYLAGGAVALAGLFLLLKSQAVRDVPVPTTVASSPKAFRLEVQGRQLVAGPQVLRVNEGDAVLIEIRCDHAEELHLHGYDRKVELEADRVATLALVADRSGRFEYELEHAGIELGALEVQPR